MSVRLVAVTFDARDPAGLAAFWGGLLGREVVEEARGALLPGSDDAGGAAVRRRHHGEVRTQPAAPPPHQRGASGPAPDGGGGPAPRARHLDVGQLPDEDHVVLADPEGNEFCVIEAGNNFLAGCGFLGEVGCDGHP